MRGSSQALATVTAIIDGTGSIGAAIGPYLTGQIIHKVFNNFSIFYFGFFKIILTFKFGQWSLNVNFSQNADGTYVGWNKVFIMLMASALIAALVSLAVRSSEDI